MRTLVLTLLFALLTAAPAVAQSSRETAARELLETMNLERQMLSGATAMVDAMITQQPGLEVYRDVIIAWAEAFMTWDVFGPKLVLIYAQAFSESELRDLLAFYRTPTGQKSLTLLPELTARAAQLGAVEAQARQGELQTMIQRRTAELQQSNGAR